MRTTQHDSGEARSNDAMPQGSNPIDLNTSFSNAPFTRDEAVHFGPSQKGLSSYKTGAASGPTMDDWAVIKCADNIADTWAQRTRVAVLVSSFSYLVGVTIWSGDMYVSVMSVIPTAFCGVVAWGVLPVVVEPTVRALYKRRHLPGNEST